MTRSMPAQWTFAVAILSLAVACERPSPEGSTIIALTGAEVVVSTDSELLGNPVDLALDSSGGLYVLDFAFGRIVRVERGGPPTILLREGRGPGELAGPITLGIGLEDTLRVDDRGNGRVMVLTASAEPVRTYTLPPRIPGPSSFGPRGELVAATLGLSEAGLVQSVDAGGRPYGYTGQLVAPAVTMWNLTAMKDAVNRGRVPDALQNHAIPAAADDGGMWLALTAEGTVRRYGVAGDLLWETAVTLPEIDRIRETFFALNREEGNPAAFHSLEYFADTYPAGEDLWVLLARAEDEPSSLVVLDRSGRLRRRFDTPDIRGARRLAVDHKRGVIYLAVPSAAAVHAIPLASTEVR